MTHASLGRKAWTAFLIGSLPLVLGACAMRAHKTEPQAEDFDPLEAPVQSPPGDLEAPERILWWQDHLRLMPPQDRSEGYLHLGDLYLEEGRAPEAREAYESAMSLRTLSFQEEARANYGIGLTFLLEDEVEAGMGFVTRALPGLGQGQAEEARFLKAAYRGFDPPPGTDPAIAMRLEPYLGDVVVVTPALAVAAPGPTGFVDLSRRSWGARPTRTNRDPMGKPYRITVHHSTNFVSDNSRSGAIAEVRSIQAAHFDRGWADVGYHFLIGAGGDVIAGRPVEYQGAHAGRDGGENHNRGNIGVCLLGDFTQQRPTRAQLQALQGLLDSLRSEYGIARGQVWWHSHFGATECPGPPLAAWVQRYRRGS